MYQISCNDNGKLDYPRPANLPDAFRYCARFLHFPLVDLLKIEHLDTLEHQDRVSFTVGTRTATIHKVQ